MKYAIISTYEKAGIVEFALKVSRAGYNIISTGKTAKVLKEAGINVIEVSEYTGFPEILDGRVKTLNPKIFGGILADRSNEAHLRTIKELSIDLIDLVVVNLYPFEKSPSVEMIDIGGPSLVRAAAKNYEHVTVVVDPNDYEWVAERIVSGTLTVEDRRRLAQKAFSLTALYDASIANWLGEEIKVVAGRLSLKLRYGENPHQAGFFYATSSNGFGRFKQHMGKPLSYNNIYDADNAYKLVLEFDEPTCCIIKHTDPCGVAVGSDLKDAFEKALSSDPVSAYGGIVGFNGLVDAELSELVVRHYFEVVVAKGYTEDAIKVFAKKPNLRVIEFEKWGYIDEFEFRSVTGGFLFQSADMSLVRDIKVVTSKVPDERELEELLFAYKVVKHVRSNAIVFTKGKKLIGLGSGQVSRVDAVRIAGIKARELGHDTKDAFMASDAFFPFPDGIEVAHSFGIKAVIQPGGSMRDEEVIKKAEELGMIMVLTGMRHFRH